MNPPNNSIFAAISDLLKRRAIYWKMEGVIFLILLLLILLAMIHSVLSERLERRNHAVTQITSVWGRQQSVIGPVLIVPYRYSVDSWKEQAGRAGALGLQGEFHRRGAKRTGVGSHGAARTI